MADVRLGLIGAGPWGRNFIRVVAEEPNVSLRWLASRNPASRRLVDAGCTVTGEWRDLAGAEDLDGVVIATPPALHVEMTRHMVKAGKAVLVEKPLTMDPAEARSLLALTEARGGLVLVDHVHLFSAPWQRLRREAGRLGPVRSVFARNGRWGPFVSEVPVLWNWASHDFALIIDLIGRAPESVAIRRTDARRLDGGLGEMFEVEADFAGVTARIEVGNLMAEKERMLRADFDDAALVYDDMAEDKLTLHRRLPGEDGSPERISPLAVGDGMPLNRAVRAFAEAIAEGKRDTANLRLAVEVTAALAGAAISGR